MPQMVWNYEMEQVMAMDTRAIGIFVVVMSVAGLLGCSDTERTTQDQRERGVSRSTTESGQFQGTIIVRNLTDRNIEKMYVSSPETPRITAALSVPEGITDESYLSKPISKPSSIVLHWFVDGKENIVRRRVPEYLETKGSLFFAIRGEKDVEMRVYDPGVSWTTDPRTAVKYRHDEGD